MPATINWIIYPLKNLKNNKISRLIGDREIIEELDNRGSEQTDLLGVMVDSDKKGYFLGAFITAERLMNSMDKGVIDSCNGLIHGEHQWLTLPFDDLDQQLAKRYKKNTPFIDELNEDQHQELMYRLIWSMRVEYSMEIDRHAFVVNGRKNSVDMFETGDNVIVWMAGGQQIYGVVSKFGTVDNKVVLKVTVTRRNSLVYNGKPIDLDIGETVTAPIGSVEIYSHHNTV
jgi:hypothetical protein